MATYCLLKLIPISEMLKMKNILEMKKYIFSNFTDDFHTTSVTGHFLNILLDLLAALNRADDSLSLLKCFFSWFPRQQSLTFYFNGGSFCAT